MFIVILFIFLGILSGVLCRKLSTGARILTHRCGCAMAGQNRHLAHLAVALPVGH